MTRAGLASLALAVPMGCTSPRAAPSPDGAVGSALRDEAGFFDVPPQAHAAPYPARLFYVFEVADSDAEHRPLVAFFAGGPGYPSSLDLLPYGLARTTLPGPALPGPPMANPARWTSFANVLFVDERQSGFSYGLGPASSDAAACSFSPIDDAADAARAVLQFLDAHAPLRSAPVVFVGQSYGGERVTLALDLLLRYRTEAARADDALEPQIQAHYDAVFPNLGGGPADVRTALSQFGRAVLLQPLVLGSQQYAAQAVAMPNDPYVGARSPGSDAYDVRQSSGWSSGIEGTASAALATAAGAHALFGIPPASIPELGPAARTNAFRVFPPGGAGAASVTNTALAASLGALGANDAYLVFPADACPVDPSLLSGTEGSSAEFVANLDDGVRTFISDARYDAVIYSPAIPTALAAGGATVTLDSTPRPGVERPGWFTVSSNAGAGPAVEVRFPPYTNSGHFVAVAQPQELHDDVAAWLVEP